MSIQQHQYQSLINAAPLIATVYRCVPLVEQPAGNTIVHCQQ